MAEYIASQSGHLLNIKAKYYNKLDIEGFSQMMKDPSYSYKFYWLEAVVHIISEGKNETTLEEIIDEMIANAWYSVREFHIHLSGIQADGLVQDGLERAILQLPLQIRVYEISGPLFFGAADVIEHIAVKDFTTCLVLRMRGVTALDSTAMNALIDTAKACEKRGITVVFSHVNKQPMKVVDKAGFIERIGKEKKF